MNKRLREFIDFLIDKRIVKNYSDFGRSIGQPKSCISDFITGKREISPYIASIIEKHYPDINTKWLLYGDGQMFKEVKTEPEFEPKSEQSSYKYSSLFCGPSVLEDKPLWLPEVTGDDFVSADEYRRVCSENTELRIVQAKLMDTISKYKSILDRLGHEC